MTLGQLGIRRGGALGRLSATDQPKNRWQTLIPIAAVAGIIYFFVIKPGMRRK